MSCKYLCDVSTEIWILVFFVEVVAIFVGWRLLTGKWIPDGSFSASQAPSGIDWKKVDVLLNENGVEHLYANRDKIHRVY